jgi:hypothetical protein
VSGDQWRAERLRSDNALLTASYLGERRIGTASNSH